MGKWPYGEEARIRAFLTSHSSEKTAAMEEGKKALVKDSVGGASYHWDPPCLLLEPHNVHLP